MPRRSRALTVGLSGLTPLVLAGLGLVLMGAVADFAFHVLAPTLPPAVGALLGIDGANAHVLTLVGMLVAVLGLVIQARTAASS